MSNENGHSKGAGSPLGADEMNTVERLQVMRSKGWEQLLPTGRPVLMRTLEPDRLLRQGDCPDILTPLMLKSLYSSSRNAVAREYLEGSFASQEEAVAYLDRLDLVVRMSLADDTQVDTLTLEEKKWIFELGMGTAQALVTFRYVPTPTVVVAPEVGEVPQATE